MGRIAILLAAIALAAMVASSLPQEEKMFNVQCTPKIATFYFAVEENAEGAAFACKEATKYSF